MEKSVEDLVRRRGAGRCEYCHQPIAPFHIEHIIARKHGGLTHADNLALSCARCNFYKGPNLSGIDPITESMVALFHPRRQKWSDHFRWNGVWLEGITPVGRATIAVLAINDPGRIESRLNLPFDERAWS